MNRIALAALSGVALFVPVSVGAVINGISPVADPGVPQSGNPTAVRVTCYGPGYDAKMEGGFETSKSGPNGRAVPCTLDDFRLKRNNCWYVTLAGNQANYNKYFNMGSITYVSVEDGREYAMTNVVGFVHDTGSAFNSSGCGKYGTCGIMMQKFDVAYGDYRGGGNIDLVNKSPFCANRSTTWLQIGGRVDAPASSIADNGYVGGNTGNTYGGYLSNGTGGSTGGGGTQPYYAMRPAGSSPYASASPVQSSGTGTTGQTIQQTPVSQQLSASPYSAVTTSQSAATSLQAALVQPTTSQGQTAVPGAPSVGAIYAQPRSVSKSGAFSLSWVSLNMKQGSCTVKQGTTTLVSGNEGTRPVSAQQLPAGAVTFTLSCTTQDGSGFSTTDTVTVY